MFAKPALAALLTPGKHGCTLGGNPICMAVAKTIFDVIEGENLLKNATELGELAIARLGQNPRISGKIAQIRGKGLMLGIELKEVPEKIVEKALDRGIILNLTAQKVIRLAPPININRQQWEQGLDQVAEILAAG
jgi:acetylornithine aminotransferase